MAKRKLLIVNLGSPSAPKPKAVKRYLNEFLTDRFVLDVPYLWRQFLVRVLITPKRSVDSAEAYQKVWTAGGSPLVVYTRQFAEKLARELGSEWDVCWAMRYGSPSIRSRIRNWGSGDIYLVPLYPQYAESSTRTVVEEVAKQVGRDRHKSLHVLKDFFHDPGFIASEVINIRRELESFKPDHLMLSFHGLPEHHLTKLHPTHCLKSADCCASVHADNRFCYRAQCYTTAREISAQLPLSAKQISVSFQSRLGRRPWIKPYTDEVVSRLAAQGARRLLVSCPSFVADCLETLEEIQMRLREQFINEGGEELKLVPAPNADDHWVSNFAKLVSSPQTIWQGYRPIHRKS